LPAAAVRRPLMKRGEEQQGTNEDNEAPVHERTSCTERANVPDEACRCSLSLYSAIGRGHFTAPFPF
jgi:hypothetical protein